MRLPLVFSQTATLHTLASMTSSLRRRLISAHVPRKVRGKGSRAAMNGCWLAGGGLF